MRSNQDLPLFDRPLHNGVDTSREAATAIAGEKQRLRDQIHAFVKDRGAWGATREEIELGLLLSGNSVRPRVKELAVQGLLRETGARRRTRSGNTARVLVASERPRRDQELSGGCGCC